jgi:SAM-dependent methyltransferase
MTPEQYAAAFEALKGQQARTQRRFYLEWEHRYPILNEDGGSSDFPRDYIYHVGWASRALRKISPSLHHDVSSSLYFVACASAWTPVKFCDIRATALHMENVTVRREDVRELSFAADSLESVSCLHVIEHVGLGRYGDELDYDGDLKAVTELKRVVRPGGDLLVVVPIACVSAIMFNAHRVYEFNTFRSMFTDRFDVVEEALIPEAQDLGLVYNPPADLLRKQNYGCGCFWFRKRH